MNKRLKWEQAHPGDKKERNRRQDQKAAENLTDRYVKKRLVRRTNLTTADLTPELIEAQRALLILKRSLK